jgi:curved DNA-binding protein CbpA
MTSPFQPLGLPARPDLTDDDVRAAWRRVAAATHPDRADRGDPAAFAAAAAAYTLLRTATGRGEALADLADLTDGRAPGHRVPGGKDRLARATVAAGSRIRFGRPLRLAVRLLAAVAAGALAVAGVGWQPASFAVITGALTWLLLTGRSDLAGPGRWGGGTGTKAAKAREGRAARARAGGCAAARPERGPGGRPRDVRPPLQAAGARLSQRQCRRRRTCALPSPCAVCAPLH